MKSIRLFSVLAIMVLALTLSLNSEVGLDNEHSAGVTRSGASPRYAVKFDEWDVAGASKMVEKRNKKPYTVMVYMNG